MQELKALTLNIHKGFSTSKRRFTLERIRDGLRASGCNLVFLQEVIGENERHRKRITGWPDTGQFEFLADSVWQHHAYGKNAVYQHGHHGNAILSEIPIVDWSNTDVSSLRVSQRGILHSILENHVHLFCVHFGLFENERRQQSDALIAMVKDRVGTDSPLLIAGDFNDWRGTTHHKLCDSLGVSEVHTTVHGGLAHTYPSLLPCLPMDSIYARGFNIVDARILKDELWQGLSDHCALSATVARLPEDEHGD